MSGLTVFTGNEDVGALENRRLLEAVMLPEKCEFQRCDKLGTLRTINVFGLGTRVVLKLCDDHDRKARGVETADHELVDWLVAIVWPQTA